MCYGQWAFQKFLVIISSDFSFFRLQTIRYLFLSTSLIFPHLLMWVRSSFLFKNQHPEGYSLFDSFSLSITLELMGVIIINPDADVYGYHHLFGKIPLLPIPLWSTLLYFIFSFLCSSLPSSPIPYLNRREYDCISFFLSLLLLWFLAKLNHEEWPKRIKNQFFFSFPLFQWQQKNWGHKRVSDAKSKRWWGRGGWGIKYRPVGYRNKKKWEDSIRRGGEERNQIMIIVMLWKSLPFLIIRMMVLVVWDEDDRSEECVSGWVYSCVR